MRIITILTLLAALLCGCQKKDSAPAKPAQDSADVAQAPADAGSPADAKPAEAKPIDATTGATEPAQTAPQPENPAPQPESPAPQPPAVDAPAPDDTESPELQEKIYDWDKVSDVCPYLDEGWQYNSIVDEEVERENDETKICLDGKEYCYAMDSRPIVKPENPEGWDCRLVQKLPSSHVIPNTYYELQKVQGYLYGDDAHRRVRKPLPWSFKKAWVCTDDECACGGKACPKDGLCIDEKCYCNDVPYKGGKCKLHWKVYHESGWDDKMESYREFLEDDIAGMGRVDYRYFTSCKDAEGKTVKDLTECEDNGEKFYCNDMEITDSSVQHCIKLADGKFAIYYDDSEENLGEHFYHDVFSIEDIRAEREGNRDNDAYRCGQETCVKGEICLKKQCVGLATRAKLPNENYTWNAFMPECTNPDGCSCAKNSCKKGEFCIEGECKDSPFYLKLRGNWVHYGYLNLISFEEDEEEVADEEEEDGSEEKKAEEKSAAPKPSLQIHPPRLAIWFDILTHTSSQACDDADIPANSANYTCLFDAIDDGRSEAPQTVVTARGFYCMNPDGCTCGKGSCPMYAQCRSGACVYDTTYLAGACHRDPSILYSGQNYRLNNRFVDERGWCHCGDSLVPPNQPRHECE